MSILDTINPSLTRYGRREPAPVLPLRDEPDLRVHAGAGDQALAASVGNQGSHERRVPAVAERDLLVDLNRRVNGVLHAKLICLGAAAGPQFRRSFFQRIAAGEGLHLRERVGHGIVSASLPPYRPAVSTT